MTAPSLERPSPPSAAPAPRNPAESYELFAVPALFAPAAERLLAAARPRPGDRVLDVGTGTGIVARLATSRVAPTGSVTGLDTNAEMLDVARSAAAQEGLAITWHESPAEHLPFLDGSFDLALSQYALMFFDDAPTALSEMRRVLAPGGRVALSVFQGIARHPFYRALDDAIARRLGKPTVAAIFAQGDADDLAQTLSRAGFREVALDSFSWTVHMGLPEHFLAGEIEIDTAALPAMQGMTSAARDELAAAVAADMAEPLRAVTVGNEVVMQFHDLVARASR